MTRKQAVISRRTVIGGALVALLPLPEQAMAGEKHGRRSDLLVLLLKGLYTPVAQGPDLGLSSVDLSDGSYSTTKIYPIIGFPGHPSEKDPIGDFYVQFAGTLCAYDLPGGSIAMEFTPVSDTVTIDDGPRRKSSDGTYELNILEATGHSATSEAATTTWSTSCTSWPPETAPAASTSTASASSPREGTRRSRLAAARSDRELCAPSVAQPGVTEFT